MARKILVVEDHEKMREVLVRLIRCEGYEVTEAVDGRDGLEKADETRPDLILADQYMPRLDGLEMIRQLRQVPAFASTPIILLSTDPDLGDCATAAGANHFMSKPMEIGRLLEIIRGSLGVEQG